MIHTLQNSFLQFSVDPRQAVWSLEGHQPPGPSLRDVQMGVHYRTRRGSFTGLGLGSSLAIGAPEVVPSPHGPLRQVRLVSDPDRNGLSYSLVFALPVEEPLLLWKINVENGGRVPVFVDRLELFNAGFIYISHASFPVLKYSGYGSGPGFHKGQIKPYPEPGELAFFSNGWQSWNDTGVYGVPDKYRRTRLGPLTTPMRVNPGTPHHKRRGLIGSDMFGILGDRTHRRAILAGFLSQVEHFGSMEALLDPFTPAFRMWANGDGARLDPGSNMDTDWACLYFLHLDAPDPLGPYLDAVARQNQIHSSDRVAGGEKQQEVESQPGQAGRGGQECGLVSGWCSWYHYFQDLNAGDIRENLEAARSLKDRLPLDLIQIDDGFEAQVGDWFDPSPGFPGGVAPLAREICKAGFTPGLWLAPFIVHRKSRLAREHPDWLLRNRFGLPVNAGFIWDSFTTGLDLTHPKALDYVREVVRTAVHEWGYPYLKLDFLYAGALRGRYSDPTRTRAQVLRTGLSALREAAGEKTYLLGCGCPLGSAIGLVDAMRIGADVDARWRPAYKGIGFYFREEPDMPSARNAIQNALTRAPLNRRWWVNDPDCLLLRLDTQLTIAEVHTLATVIALSGGSLLLSDRLAELPPERLRIAEVLLPLIGKTPYLLDWFDNPTPTRLQLDLEGPEGTWRLLALFNWGDQPEDLSLRLNDFYLDPTREYHVRSFWDGKTCHIPADGAGNTSLAFENVPAHGVVALALRQAFPGEPRYLGSDLHISQGREVISWKWDSIGKTTKKVSDSQVLSLRLERPGKAQGEIVLSLPNEPRQAFIEERLLSWHIDGEGYYHFHVEFDRSADITLLL